MIKTISKKFLTLIFFVVLALILAVSIRGRAGNPTAETINTPYWKDLGPLELSPDRGRFALTYSLVEDKSFYFSLPIARFVTPDLGYKDGHYVSLFAPGVSFLIIPGYLLGKMVGISQVGSFAVIALFGFLNAFLIKKICQVLGANSPASNIAAASFLLATPAFAYAVSLYQHQISAFALLLSVWLLFRFKGLWPLLGVWFLLGTSVIIDYPNAIFAAPIGIYALSRMISVEKAKKIKISFKLAGILTFITVGLPLAFFMYVNQVSYGNPFQLAGTVTAVKAIDALGKPTIPTLTPANLADQFSLQESLPKSAVGFFQTRLILHDFYIHLFSPDRGVMIYAPVVLFGAWGLYLLYKRFPHQTALIAGIVLTNLLLYSMWDDPWGGWAFGSRYLIISYAFLAIGIGYILTILRRRYLVTGVFALVFTYSALVNTLGAITSSQNPPQESVLQLEAQTHKEEKYTFARNSVYLLEHGSKSYIYQTYLSQFLSPVQFYLSLAGLIILATLSQITLLQMAAFTEKEYKLVKLPGKQRFSGTRKERENYAAI